MMHCNKKIIAVFVLMLAAAFFFGSKSALAATMQLSPSSGNYSVGSTVRVAVTVSSPAQAINAASGVLTFPADKLQFVSASKDGSIMTIWAQDPAYSGYGTVGNVTFEGVIPNPGYVGSGGKIVTATFLVKAVGTATLSFSSASVLANDGMGTNVLSSYIPGTLTLGATTTTPPPPAPIIEDTSSSNTPSAPKIVSSSHPDSTLWYADANPRFSWSLPSGVTGVARLIDKNPTSNPGSTSVGAISGYTASDLADGTWYLHLRFRNANGWGKTAHFRFGIDREKPQSFTIEPVAKTDPKDPISQFRFITEDRTSGVERYEIQIDNAYFITWIDPGAHIYATTALGPGKHSLFVKAIDGAGNFITSSTAFEVAGIASPVITEYPKYLKSDSYLLLKGMTYPNAKILVTINKTKSEGIFTTQPLVFTRDEDLPEAVHTVVADDRGAFTFVSPNKLQSGTYRVWAVAVNELGASSEPSNILTIPVSVGALAKIGFFVINLFTILAIFIVLLAILLFMIIHGHYKVRHLRERLIGKYFGNDRDGKAGLAYLDSDLQKEIVAIQKKIVEKEKVTEAEKAFLVRIKKVLSAVEDLVEEEMSGSKEL